MDTGGVSDLSDASDCDESAAISLGELMTAAEQQGFLKEDQVVELASAIVHEIEETLGANNESSGLGIEWSGVNNNDYSLLFDATAVNATSTSPGEKPTDCSLDDETFISNFDSKDPDYEPIESNIDESESSDEDVLLPCDRPDVGIDGVSRDDRNGSEEIAESRKKMKGRNMKEESKKHREIGEKYTGYRRKIKGKSTRVAHDVERDARKMGPTCNSGRCRKWKNRRSCHEISEEDRSAIFEQFWKEMSWEVKKMYVCGLVTLTEIRSTSKKGEQSRRAMSFFYNLRVGNRILPVCKKMFLNTLGLGEKAVRLWVVSYNAKGSKVNRNKSAASQLGEKEDIDGTNDDEGQHGEDDVGDDKGLSIRGHSRNSLQRKTKHLEQFLNDLPKLPSHYMRKDSSKLYLQTDFTSVAELFDVYKAKCCDDRVEPLCRSTFDKTYKRLNIGIFTPRKDQCDLCCNAEVNNVGAETLQLHRTLKDRAQEEKKLDKLKGVAGDLHVISVDLMAVQVLPRLLASAAYYKLKIQVHNYSIFNLVTHDVKCYWWDETVASLDASTYASCLVDYIEELIGQEKKNVIIWSDGCTPQNRNKVLSNALLHLSVKQNIVIVHKYLEKGHTQMEVDSVHAHIEEQIRKHPIYLPSNYLERTIRARKNPTPYRAVYLSYNFFTNYEEANGMIYSSIRPGNQKDDPVVTDLRWLQYEPNGTIKYKVDFDGELKLLPRRPNLKAAKFNDFPKLCRAPRPITLDKYNDLKSLKDCGIPLDCHSFYDLLPHQTNSIREEKRRLQGSKRKRIDSEED